MDEAVRQLDESRPSVLVIDDSSDVHRLLRARLRQEELNLVCAASGDEGLREASAKCPALILLDLDMPSLDGFEVLRRLKDDPALLNIPVIILSGLQTSQDKVTAFDLGAVDYITKPFDLTELRVRVRSALKMHTLVQMLAQRAQIDGLTGLWNRRYFDERFANEVAGVDRHRRPLSLALFDIDHFKSVNDTFGHPAGDAVLQGFARLVQRESRQTDIACRFGGEEFALIMPDTGPSDALGVCERIRLALADLSWPRHPERKVTVSSGLAGSSGTGSVGVAQWIEAADKSLYTSKKSGRNRITLADLSSPPRLAQAG